MRDVINQGLAEHLNRFHGRLSAGEERLGWKVAFNAPSIQERLGISGSLVAGLTRTTLRDSGATYSLRGANRVALEAEVAVWLGADIVDGASVAAAAAAISAWGPAIEIVELDRSFDELELILAEGVFHRAVLPGPKSTPSSGAELAGIVARVQLGDGVVCELDARAATGHAPEVLLHLAALLAPFGEGLRAGDLVILGAMNPLTLAEAGKPFSVDLGALGASTVSVVE